MMTRPNTRSWLTLPYPVDGTTRVTHPRDVRRLAFRAW